MLHACVFSPDYIVPKEEKQVFIDKANNQMVMSYTEDLRSIPNASGFLVTVEKKLPLKSLAPGQYAIRLKVFDKLKNQALTPSALFTVTS